MIYIANYEKDRIGGGWSFMSNLAKGLGDQLTTDLDQADVYFICSPTMVQREDVQKAKDQGKKIILRLDNAVRNSRNRNTGMSRMKDFADWADLIVFQSEWSRDYLNEFLGVSASKQTVILNSVDTDVFYPGVHADNDYFLYSRFNRDETKNFEVARYWYSRAVAKGIYRDPNLFIVGQFSPELQAGHFDFYNNEPYSYFGTIDRETLANLYRNCKYLIYTYFNDACSNTLIEALVSGCEIVGDNYYIATGGAPEIINAFEKKGRDYFSLQRMVKDYKDAINVVL